MTDNGLAALAAALYHVTLDEDDEGFDGEAGWQFHGSRDDLAAAILGPRGVFLPDGLRSVEIYNHWAALLDDQAATIATLRAALDGLVAAAERHYQQGSNASADALRVALAAAEEAGG
jgi:hypothetical protein